VPTREQLRVFASGLDDTAAIRKQVAAWLKARGAADEPPDAITVLGRQHSQVRHLMKELQALPGYTDGGSAEQMAARKSIVDMIIVRLSEHETIEEEHFWPSVRKALPDGGHCADQALGEEREGKDTLAELGRLDPDSREFDERVERLVSAVRKHVAVEEQVFLKMRAAVPPEDLERLGAKLVAAMKGGAA
jgi:hypothetical protein